MFLTKKGWRSVAAVIAVTLALPCVSSAAQTTTQFRPNEVLVKYKSGVRRSRVAMESLYTAAGVSQVRRFRGIFRNIEQVVLGVGADLTQTIEALRRSPLVEYAQPNYILKALPIEQVVARTIHPTYGCWIPGVPFPPGCSDGGSERPPVGDKPGEVNPPVADPELGEAYGIAKIGADRAWQISPGSQGVVVAVIDTGVDYNHEDLAFNMWRNPAPTANDLVGWDFVHNDNLPFDDHMHGTHCAGTIGAVGGNGVGVAGVSPRVSIMALKFLDSGGSGDTASAIRAIDYAITAGAHIMSNSWGGSGGEGTDENRLLLEAIQRSEAAGRLFVAAAGNESNNNDTNPTYPAAYETANIVTVAATDRNDRMASFSNFGQRTVHLAAPGVSVYSSTPGNRYQTLSGTSMACPHVAGAAALLWSARPDLNFAQVKAALMGSVDHLPELEGKVATAGRLNIARALGLE